MIVNRNNKNMNCLLCGNTAELLDPNYPGYQEPEKFGIYYCPSCNTSFSYPRVDTKHIYEHIYKHVDKLFGYDRYVEYANVVKTHKNPLQYLSESEETYWSVKCALEQTSQSKDSLRVIEIGCGLGYLTYSLVRDGYCATGLDISQNAIDKATKNFGNYYVCADILEYATQHKNVYDVVILTEVIEHIEHPIDFLKSVMLLINDNITSCSKIILTTPNKTIYEKDIIWQTDLPPVHLWWFSEKSMNYIASQLNANIQFINFSNYYKKKPKYLRIKNFGKVQRIKHIFDKDGNIIEQIETNFSLKKLRSLIVRLPFAKYFYYKLYHHYIRCGKKCDKGDVLAIVLNKINPNVKKLK
jgi:2-polyprenyl-3-methyl-5-hydroxy-6-metoxy-1,4-benzoquinol methylase